MAKKEEVKQEDTSGEQTEPEVKQEETFEEVQVVNEDGFIAGQEIDSKTYFEFIAKQRNS